MLGGVQSAQLTWAATGIRGEKGVEELVGNIADGGAKLVAQGGWLSPPRGDARLPRGCTHLESRCPHETEILNELEKDHVDKAFRRGISSNDDGRPQAREPSVWRALW